ncbi:MAG: putative sulfate exporter family transporter [Gammaproteobacteria bacterium]|nr:putative sulfate exporter family transporter [Gammaproteobacteria bacterium]
MTEPETLAATPMRERAQTLAPGLLIASVIAMAAAFISEHYGGPVMLMALLLGMAFNFLSDEQRFSSGIDFSSGVILRIGVALLGLRITYADIVNLGVTPIALVCAGLALTMLAGLVVARQLGLTRHFAVLTAGAVSICGASAAMAIAAVLPRHPQLERDTCFTVVAVTTLSTLAMIIYPVIVSIADLDNAAAGMFLGATIHDVAQVVGAGYMVSDEAGDVATFTKLLRVAMLVPLIIVILLTMPKDRNAGLRGLGIVPIFLVVFMLLVVANSLGWVPETPRQFLVGFSRGCLIVAIAALGVKTSLKELASVGGAAIGLVVAETVILAALALAILGA